MALTLTRTLRLFRSSNRHSFDLTLSFRKLTLQLALKLVLKLAIGKSQGGKFRDRLIIKRVLACPFVVDLCRVLVTIPEHRFAPGFQ
jgi:hypothetical protein